MVETVRLLTERLILRIPDQHDLDDLTEQIQDYAIARNTLNIPYPYERAMADDWLTIVNDELNKKTAYRFVMCLRDTDRLIGSIGIHFENRHKRAEIGYWLGKTFWNQGYTTEALQRVIEFGFEELGFVRIQATHFTSNPSSGRVMQKVGMIQEGILRDYFLKWEQLEDVAMYAITRTDWLAQKG